MKKRVWISCDKQRLTLELAHHFGCDLFVFEYDGILRYPVSIWHTLLVLLKEKPKFLFVQNPSMILATFACLYGMLTSTFVIVDRHTTFHLSRSYKKTIRILVFKLLLLHRFTLRFADLTIVTNAFLADIVMSYGGKAFVLPDKIPSFNNPINVPLKEGKNILYISSFATDEPMEEVFKAMSLLQSLDVFLHISGNYQKLNDSVRKKAPANVIFTGYLSDNDFVSLLHSVDIVMVLTTNDYCMLCGCYEAVAACKPLITSKKKVLEDYFTEAVFVENTTDDISNGIIRSLENSRQYKEDITKLKERLSSSWNKQYDNLEAFLDKVANVHVSEN